MKKLLPLLLLLCLWSCNKNNEPTGPKKPTMKTPPEDVWASMRKLEKLRKEVDTGLTNWDAAMISTGTKEVSREILLLPELYEGIPKDFMQYANILKAKSDATMEAMKTEDFAQARANWGEVLRACQGCHEVWSGPKRGYELPPETPRPEPPPASVPVDPKCGKKGQKKCPKANTTVQDPFKQPK
jgi:cytochrome c556